MSTTVTMVSPRMFRLSNARPAERRSDSGSEASWLQVDVASNDEKNVTGPSSASKASEDGWLDADLCELASESDLPEAPFSTIHNCCSNWYCKDCTALADQDCFCEELTGRLCEDCISSAGDRAASVCGA